MNIIFILILVSAFIATTFVVAFIWSVKSGQYDDMYSPSVRLLFDSAKDKIQRKKTIIKPNKVNKKDNHDS